MSGEVIKSAFRLFSTKELKELIKVFQDSSRNTIPTQEGKVAKSEN